MENVPVVSASVGNKYGNKFFLEPKNYQKKEKLHNGFCTTIKSLLVSFYDETK